MGVFAALETGRFTTVTYLMGILGTDVLAAHQIVLQTAIVIFMVPLGMSFAAPPASVNGSDGKTSRGHDGRDMSGSALGWGL